MYVCMYVSHILHRYLITEIWHVLKPETAKRNDRNETCKTNETTKTKQSKRNHRKDQKLALKKKNTFNVWFLPPPKYHGSALPSSYLRYMRSR